MSSGKPNADTSKAGSQPVPTGKPNAGTSKAGSQPVPAGNPSAGTSKAGSQPVPPGNPNAGTSKAGSQPVPTGKPNAGTSRTGSQRAPSKTQQLIPPPTIPQPNVLTPTIVPPEETRERVFSTAAEMEERRGSLPLVCLKDDELEFFELVETGTSEDVKKFLNDNKDININCINYQGISALHVAIKREEEDLVNVLLKRPDLEIKDAALHAVATGNIDITNIVLDALNLSGSGTEMQGYEESPEYSSDITPLMLAAHCSDYKMVRLLLARGHTIEKTHMPSCLCPKCKTAMLAAGSSLSRNRLHAYRAISDPSYICQITDDPIYCGFLLDKEMKKCALMDKEFRAEYEELGQNVRDFTVGIISQCRNTADIETLLRLSWGYKAARADIEFPRLQLALDYNQKEFVGHSMVQQVLTYYWLGDYRSWPRLSLKAKVGQVLIRIILLPFICLTLMFAPQVRQMRKCHAPVNRYLLSLASYLIFVLLVFLLNFLDTGRKTRGPPNTGLEAIVVIYVLGYMWATFQQFWLEGYSRFFSVPWHWYDVTMEGLFFLSFLLWAKSDFDVLSDHIHKKRFLERKYWHCFDATLLHEGLFAVASILCFGRLAYFCLQSSRLGPLQISIGKMAMQVGAFLIFCFLLITSFSMPVSRLYAYYDGMVQTNKDGQTRTQLSSFSTFMNSFSTFFWAMFCMSPVESADVVIENLVQDKTNPVLNFHGFTEMIGRALFATYELLMVIALLNTLIAILSNTFQKVVDNADIEWKFARTKLWIHYLHEASPLPSPFNLLPTPRLFMNLYTYFLALSKKIPGATAKFTLTRCCFVEYEKEYEMDQEEYETLMSNLVQRYFRAKEAEAEDN